MPRILDVIECTDMGTKEMVHRIPERGQGDFRLGSQLIVREGQAAVFFRDGKALDTFGPGRHTISVANLPLLDRLVKGIFGGKTIFTAECYFVNTRDLIDQRWGTSEPIALRDEVLRMVRIRAHGTYNMTISDPQMFVAQMVGARGYYSTQDITDYLRGAIISRLTDLLGEQAKSILDLPALFNEISAMARVQLGDDFAALGLTLKRLYIMSISPTEETSKAMDEAASMGAIGDMNAYMKFKTARAVGDAAQAEGGAAAGTAQIGLGLGAGMAAAKVMAEGLTGQTQPAAGAGAAAASSDPVATLKTLKDMLDAGLVSQEEYDAKKAEILSRL